MVVDVSIGEAKAKASSTKACMGYAGRLYLEIIQGSRRMAQQIKMPATEA